MLFGVSVCGVDGIPNSSKFTIPICIMKGKEEQSGVRNASEEIRKVFADIRSYSKPFRKVFQEAEDVKYDEESKEYSFSMDIEGKTHKGRFKFVADMAALWSNFGLQYDFKRNGITPSGLQCVGKKS